jgi:hypothetical protein
VCVVCGVLSVAVERAQMPRFAYYCAFQNCINYITQRIYIIRIIYDKLSLHLQRDTKDLYQRYVLSKIRVCLCFPISLQTYCGACYKVHVSNFNSAYIEQ